MIRIRVSEKQSFAAVERDAFIQRVYEVLRSSWVAAVESRGGDSVKAMLDGWLEPLALANIRSEALAARAMNVFFALSCDFAADPLRVAWVEQAMAQGRAEAGDAAAAGRVAGLEQSLFDQYERTAQHG